MITSFCPLQLMKLLQASFITSVCLIILRLSLCLCPCLFEAAYVKCYLLFPNMPEKSVKMKTAMVAPSGNLVFEDQMIPVMSKEMLEKARFLKVGLTVAAFGLVLCTLQLVSLCLVAQAIDAHIFPPAQIMVFSCARMFQLAEHTAFLHNFPVYLDGGGPNRL